MSSMAVVVVSYNACDDLRRCLASVCADTDTVVIDNGSTDGSREMVRREFPRIRLIENARNLGYGGAANVAFGTCETDYVLLLNSDTILRPDSVRILQTYLDDNPRVGVAGPQLRNGDGTLQPSCYPFPTPFQVFLEESTLGRVAARLPLLRARSLRSWPHDDARAVPWVLGAALAIRRQAFLEVGGFDPAFFMYFEETDLCYRMAEAGWSVHFTPATSIVHIGGASTRQYAAEMQYRLFASRRLFYRRHYSRAYEWLMRAVVASIVAARYGRDAARNLGLVNERQRKELSSMLPTWKRILRECLFSYAQSR